ncbi:MAG: energy transducer TonB [Candidatus Acidiferrales bacterium]
MFAKALAVSDLRASGSPPFEMRATITVKQRFGKPSIGSYLLEWSSPDKWREEIQFANYIRIRVGGNDQYWQSRTTPYEAQPVLELDRGLDFLKSMHVWSKPEAIADLNTVKLHQEKVEGTKSDCVTLILKQLNYGPDYCFDPVKGVLVLDRRSSTEFSEFTSFAGKLFPGNIHIKEESAAPVTFVVNSIAPLGSTNSADFQPPDDSASWPYCDAPDSLEKVIQQVGPVYPDSERLNHTQGTVFFYAVIGTEGWLHDLKVLSAPDSGLADSAVTALGHWQYAPETCHGTPIPVETLIAIHFDLGG